MQETSRDLSVLVVPQAGRVVATDDAWEPYRLVDGDGIAVESVAAYLRDLQAAGRSAATARSYGLDLLRWFRFLWAVEIGWDRATRSEARDFCRWLQIAGKPTRPHWRRRDEPAGGALSGGGLRVRPYAASVRAHSETVLRSFYDFHLDAGTGPILNPFPLDRSRQGRRGHAHRNPMDPPRNERAGLYRPTVPTRLPRSVPDEEFNDIFARLGSHRDRALVAFYVSTGARASELLSVTQAGPTRGAS
jgi:integrase